MTNMIKSSELDKAKTHTSSRMQTFFPPPQVCHVNSSNFGAVKERAGMNGRRFADLCGVRYAAKGSHRSGKKVQGENVSGKEVCRQDEGLWIRVLVVPIVATSPDIWCILPRLLRMHSSVPSWRLALLYTSRGEGMMKWVDHPQWGASTNPRDYARALDLASAAIALWLSSPEALAIYRISPFHPWQVHLKPTLLSG